MVAVDCFLYTALGPRVLRRLLGISLLDMTGVRIIVEITCHIYIFFPTSYRVTGLRTENTTEAN